MVAELHVAAVRALLSGDVGEHLRLVKEVGSEDSVDAYGLFYKVVFERAVRTCFGSATRGDVIRFVAQARANRSSSDVDIDALAAERLMFAMLGDEEALVRLSEEDSALIGPLLLELAGMVPHEELLADAVAMADQLETALSEGMREHEK